MPSNAVIEKIAIRHLEPLFEGKNAKLVISETATASAQKNVTCGRHS